MDFLKKLFRRRPEPPMGSPASNDAVRATLAQFGDDGSRIRHVLHYAYPLKAADPGRRAEIIGALEEMGLSVKSAVAENGLVMEQYRPVAPDDFDKATAELSAFFAERGWDYDGWECAVANEETSDAAKAAAG